MKLSDWLLPGNGRLASKDLGLLQTLSSLLPVDHRVGLVHPSRGEQRALPRLDAISERAWDLRYRRAPEHEVLVVGRLPDFGRAGDQRLENALASCRLLCVLDAPAQGVEHPRLLGRTLHGDTLLSLYRGDFTDPLLRVDDYPSGVRPILADLSLLHQVLRQIDQAGIRYHLGVVPAILEERMFGFLTSLEQVEFSMHGFEHGYAKYSKLLLDAEDPFNQRGTVSGFDEFRDADYDTIVEKLRQGRDLFAERLGAVPRSYIPPTNAANRRTGRALLELGFEYVLSEKPIPGSVLPCIASDFYGRSTEFRAESRPRVASLHATWEADLARAGDTRSLPAFLAALTAQRDQTRREVNELAAKVSAHVSEKAEARA